MKNGGRLLPAGVRPQLTGKPLLDLTATRSIGWGRAVPARQAFSRWV